MLCLLLVTAAIVPAFSFVAAADGSSADGPGFGEQGQNLTAEYDVEPIDPGPPGGPDAGDATKHSITLITGHTVTVVERPDGRFYDYDGDASLRRVTTDNGTYVFPEGTDFERFDRDLFNVDLLIEENLTDAESDSIPVIVESKGSENRRTGDVHALDAIPDVAVTSNLESIGANAGVVGKRGAAVASAELQSTDEIERVYLDRTVEVALDGADGAIGASAARSRYGVSGDGVTVSVIDSGIDDAHPDLKGRIGMQKDFTGEGTTEDLTGHGTHVAGIVAGDGSASDGEYVGIAPKATLLNARALGENGGGRYSWIINAIEWSVEQDADVISMSLGGGARDDRKNDPLVSAVESATDAGVVVVTSAGNSGYNGYETVTSPGVAASAITVGATAKNGDLAGFSSRGPTPGGYIKPDIVAPGRGIVSARADGTGTAISSNDYYTRKSGTSMAAPVVSGAAALLLEANPDWSPDRIKDGLTSTADPLDGYDEYQQGAGELNATAALGTDLVVAGATTDFGTYSSDTTATRTVGIRNLGDEPRTLDVSAAAENIDTGEAGTVRVNESTITVGPGETGWVDLTVDTDTAPGFYAGRLTFDSGHTAIFGYGRTNDPPTAAFAFDLETPRTGQTVTFDASESSDPDGTIERYEWDLDGDGTFEERGETVERTYDEPGTREVTLRVVDDVGDADTTTTNVAVERNEPPTVVLDSNASGDVEIGDPVEFNASDSTDDTGIDAYEWDLDDDGTVDERGPVVTHAFHEVGEQRVTLTVRDTEGNEGTANETVSVVDTVPPDIEITDLRNETASVDPTNETLRTNGTLAVNVTADGTPGDPEAVLVTLVSESVNFRVTENATRSDGVWTAKFDSADVPDDGAYTVEATAIDAGGNEETDEASVDFDREPPHFGTSVDRINATTARVNVSADEPLSTEPAVGVAGPAGNQTVSLSGSDGNWTGTFALNETGGEYRTTVNGTDRTGNEGTAAATTRFDTVSTENETATIRFEESGLFVQFDTTADVENESVTLTEGWSSTAALGPELAGVSFLDGRLSENLSQNLSQATVGIPVPDALPGDVSPEQVAIRFYDADNETWNVEETDVREIDSNGSNQTYWVANVTHFSTYGAVVEDDEPPTLESKTHDSNTLDYGTTAETITFEYDDALSGVNASAVELAFDGRNVTDDDATSITSRSATHRAADLEPGTYTTTVTVVDRAGVNATFDSAFTIPEDTTEPTLSITDPADGAVFDAGTGSVDLSADIADAESGIASVRVEFDGENVTDAATVSDDRVEYTADGLEDGTSHEFVVALADEADNRRTERVGFSIEEPSSDDGNAPSGGGGAPPPPSILTDVDAIDDATATVTVNNARPGERARTKLPPIGTNGVEFTRVDLALDAKIPAFSLDLAASEAAPSGTAELDQARPLAYLATTGDRVDSSDLESATFDVRVERTILPDGTSLDDVSIYAYDDGWQRLDTDRNRRTFTATAPPFAPLAVGVDTSSPELAVRDATVDARTVAVGEEITVTATAENVGSREGTFDVELLADERSVSTQSVTLDAGEETTVSFAYAPTVEGTVSLAVGTVSAGDVTVVDTVRPENGQSASGGQPGFGAGLAAVVVLLVAWFARRR